MQSPAKDWCVVDVEGRLAARAVATVAGEAAISLAPWRHLEADGMRIANLPRFGAPAFTIMVEWARLTSIIDAIIDRARAAGLAAVGPVGAEALEIVRVEQGIARVGLDTGEKTIALEARMERAISFNKGCYLGQETIERATARGGLKKKLYGLRFAGERLPPVGGAVMLEAREVGRLTSVVRSPRTGVIGLSILHHSAWQPGTRVTIAGADGEFSASVSDLPFA